MNANQRTALYISAGSIITAISVWGFLSEEEAAAILAVVNGLLGVIMAFTAVNNITPDEDPHADEVDEEDPVAE